MYLDCLFDEEYLVRITKLDRETTTVLRDDLGRMWE